MIVVDGHEDLAWNKITFGRDYTRSVSETRAIESAAWDDLPNGQTLLGWQEWVKGRVTLIFATLFAKPIRYKKGVWDHVCYENIYQAKTLYQQQLEIYERMVEESADRFRLIQTRTDLEATLETWQEPDPPSPQIGLVLLMEGGEGVETPLEVEAWYARGLRILGPAWSGTRFCGGTQEPGPLTDVGRQLLDWMADLGLVLDLSHMAERAALEALDRYDGVLIASHSNVLALVPNSEKPDRHLTDDVIERLIEREGVIGVVPYNRFLLGGWQPEDGRSLVTVEHLVAHLDSICQRAGQASHVAVGSDFDGGFGLDQVPSGLDSIADLRLIGEALISHGYSQEDVAAILGGNWLRILWQVLPER